MDAEQAELYVCEALEILEQKIAAGGASEEEKTARRLLKTALINGREGAGWKGEAGLRVKSAANSLRRHYWFPYHRDRAQDDLALVEKAQAALGVRSSAEEAALLMAEALEILDEKVAEGDGEHADADIEKAHDLLMDALITWEEDGDKEDVLVGVERLTKAASLDLTAYYFKPENKGRRRDDLELLFQALSELSAGLGHGEGPHVSNAPSPYVRPSLKRYIGKLHGRR